MQTSYLRTQTYLYEDSKATYSNRLVSQPMWLKVALPKCLQIDSISVTSISELSNFPGKEIDAFKFCNTHCITYFSTAVLKHGDPGNLQKERVVCTLQFQRETSPPLSPSWSGSMAASKYHTWWQETEKKLGTVCGCWDHKAGPQWCASSR